MLRKEKLTRKQKQRWRVMARRFEGGRDEPQGVLVATQTPKNQAALWVAKLGRIWFQGWGGIAAHSTALAMGSLA